MEKNEDRRNLTVHLEYPDFSLEFFREETVRKVEWDAESFDEEGVVLCFVISSSNPHKMVAVYLTHIEVKELIEEYKRLKRRF